MRAFPSSTSTVGTTPLLLHNQLLLRWVGLVEDCRVWLIWGLSLTKIQPLKSGLRLSSEKERVGPPNSWSFRTEFRQTGG